MAAPAVSKNRALVREFARSLVESKKKEVKDGITRADVMSLLGMLDVLSIRLNGLFTTGLQSNQVPR